MLPLPLPSNPEGEEVGKPLTNEGKRGMVTRRWGVGAWRFEWLVRRYSGLLGPEDMPALAVLTCRFKPDPGPLFGDAEPAAGPAPLK